MAYLLSALMLFAGPPEPADPPGTLVRPVWSGGTIRLVDENGVVGAPQPSVRLPPGTWTIILERPDHRPVRGTIEVDDEPLALSANVEPLPDLATGEVWATLSIGIGLSMVLTVGILQAADVEESREMITAQAILASLGSAGFIGGGVGLSWLYRNAYPDPAPGEIEVLLGAGPVRGGAILTTGATF